MTGAARNRAWVAVGIALSAAFALLAHAAIVNGVPPISAPRSARSGHPPSAWALRRAPRPGFAASRCGHGDRVGLGWHALEQHFTDLLRRARRREPRAGRGVRAHPLAGGEPSCTRCAPGARRHHRARRAHLRGVTIACAFFAAMFTPRARFLTEQRAPPVDARQLRQPARGRDVRGRVRGAPAHAPGATTHRRPRGWRSRHFGRARVEPPR